MLCGRKSPILSCGSMAYVSDMYLQSFNIGLSDSIFSSWLWKDTYLVGILPPGSC